MERGEYQFPRLGKQADVIYFIRNGKSQDEEEPNDVDGRSFLIRRMGAREEVLANSLWATGFPMLATGYSTRSRKRGTRRGWFSSICTRDGRTWLHPSSSIPGRHTMVSSREPRMSSISGSMTSGSTSTIPGFPGKASSASVTHARSSS